MSKAKILVEEKEDGVVLKIETDPPINETVPDDLDKCQHFVLGLISLGQQTHIWQALKVKEIEGDLKPKQVGAEIIDLHLDNVHGVNMNQAPKRPEPPKDDGPQPATG